MNLSVTRRPRRLSPLLATLAVSAAAATTLALPASASAAPASAAAVDCASGDVCFWTGFNFTGSKCSWSVADPDWQSGAIKCSWAATTNVKSVWNAGDRVVQRCRLLREHQLQRPDRLHPAAAGRQPRRYLQGAVPPVDHR